MTYLTDVAEPDDITHANPKEWGVGRRSAAAKRRGRSKKKKKPKRGDRAADARVAKLERRARLPPLDERGCGHARVSGARQLATFAALRELADERGKLGRLVRTEDVAEEGQPFDAR